GMLGASFVLRCRGRDVSGLWPLAAMVLLCATFYFDSYGQVPAYYDVWNYAAPCTLLITAGALWDISRQPRYPRWMMTLGDASYALYLMHYVERDWIHDFLRNHPELRRSGDDLAAVAGCVAIVLSAVAFHWWIERPVVRWCNRALETGIPRIAAVPRILWTAGTIVWTTISRALTGSSHAVGRAARTIVWTAIARALTGGSHAVGRAARAIAR